MLIVTTPHLVMYADYFHISRQGRVRRYGPLSVAALNPLAAEYDMECAEENHPQAGKRRHPGRNPGGKGPSLDQGTFLPLSFLQEAG